MCDEKNEIFVLEIDNISYIGHSYEEMMNFLKTHTGKEVTKRFMIEVFNNDRTYYI